MSTATRVSPYLHGRVITRTDPAGDTLRVSCSHVDCDWFTFASRGDGGAARVFASFNSHLLHSTKGSKP